MNLGLRVFLVRPLHVSFINKSHDTLWLRNMVLFLDDKAALRSFWDLHIFFSPRGLISHFFILSIHSRFSNTHLFFFFNFLSLVLWFLCWYKDFRYLNFHFKDSYIDTWVSPMSSQSHTNLSFFFRCFERLCSVDGCCCWPTYSGLGILCTFSLLIFTTTHGTALSHYFHFVNENTVAYRCKSYFW